MMISHLVLDPRGEKSQETKRTKWIERTYKHNGISATSVQGLAAIHMKVMVSIALSLLFDDSVASSRGRRSSSPHWCHPR
jgi:hypothetical protein